MCARRVRDAAYDLLTRIKRVEEGAPLPLREQSGHRQYGRVECVELAGKWRQLGEREASALADPLASRLRDGAWRRRRLPLESAPRVVRGIEPRAQVDRERAEAVAKRLLVSEGEESPPALDLGVEVLKSAIRRVSRRAERRGHVAAVNGRCATHVCRLHTRRFDRTAAALRGSLVAEVASL